MSGTATALILGVAMALGASAPAAALGRSDTPVQPSVAAGDHHSGDVDVEGYGTLSGFVRLEGSAPAWDDDPCEGELVDQHQHGGDSKATTIEHDHHACGEFRSLVVDANNGLKFGVVSARAGDAQLPEPPQPVFDQIRLEFVPHVLAVTAGQEVLIKNSDDTLHNFHARLGAPTVVNVGMPAFRKEFRHTFQVPGVYQITCDVHAHMRGYIVVFEPGMTYTVTAADGSFTLENVAAGDRHVHVWHEGAGTHEYELRVEAGATAVLDTSLEMGGHNDSHTGDHHGE